MLPEPGANGALPPGRYRATKDQVRARFVDGRGAQRVRLWRDWQSTTNLLTRHVRVNAAWLYGPFLSEAADPAVVHCVYWAEDLELGKAELDPTVKSLLRAYALPGQVRRLVGVQVDTQLAHWHCQPNPQVRDDYYAQYLSRRGYVDDLLQRIASDPLGMSRAREDALPRRGYVEVIIDDYI